MNQPSLHPSSPLSAGVLASILVAIPILPAPGLHGASPKNQSESPRTESAQKLETLYNAQLLALKTELESVLPKAGEQKITALKEAIGAVKAAEQQLKIAGDAAGKTAAASEGLGIWKKYSLPDATKKIAEAKALIESATTETARAAAQKTLAEQQKRLASVQDNITKAEELIAGSRGIAGKESERKLKQEKADAEKALALARARELTAAKALLEEVGGPLQSDSWDVKLAKAVVIAKATPHALAEFAQQDGEQSSLVEKLLHDEALLKQMLEAGGASFGEYTRAIKIYASIQQSSTRAREGHLQRLALATALEHARPVAQSNALDQPNAPATVDPVNRYLHYEKAFLAGELDPAFKNFSVWEYRKVVGCNAPDHILAWGREALRNFRPDHVTAADYGWRYVAAVRTEVSYGSQCVKDDLPSLNPYQNIPKDGGVCGRRAFFGRFILQSFGIPVWGVTQHAHAAVSHWTPKGWVVNLGAGFHYSWWDKDEAPRSGSDFLLETQARAAGPQYWRVIRAQSISTVLGETAYNERKRVAGGFWSSMAHYQTSTLASSAVELAPLGQELAEANEPEAQPPSTPASPEKNDAQVPSAGNGTLTIPAALHGAASGSALVLKSFSGGNQLHCNGGFSTRYSFQAPRTGRYTLIARVATLQEGQKFLLRINDTPSPRELKVPYTVGMWQPTQPLEVSLVQGSNTLHFESAQGSRAVAVKEFVLTPVF